MTECLLWRVVRRDVRSDSSGRTSLGKIPFCSAFGGDQAKKEFSRPAHHVATVHSLSQHVGQATGDAECPPDRTVVRAGAPKFLIGGWGVQNHHVVPYTWIGYTPRKKFGLFGGRTRCGIVIILFFLLITHNSQLTTNSYAATDNFAKAESKIKIEPAKKTLRVGEKFVYGVYWMGINVGEGTLEVKELTTISGREAYHIIAVARSNDFLSAFYKVEDVVHSYIDKKDLCSLRFEKHQREGRYKADEIVIFDQEKHKGYYKSLLNKKKKTFDIPPKVHDISSAFYYFRTLDVKPDSKITLDVNSDEKNWKAVMNVMGVQQLEILRRGVHKVLCVEPKAPFRGVISKRSKAWIYFTVDENRVPVLIKIRIPFGFVAGVLEKTE